MIIKKGEIVMENSQGINTDLIQELESKGSLTAEEQKELDHQLKMIDNLTEAKSNPEAGDMHQY